MAKKANIFACIFLITSCYTIKNTDQSVLVKLKTQQSNLRGLPFQNIKNVLIENVSPVISDTAGINLPVDTFVIKRFDFYPEQDIYLKYKTEKINRDIFTDFVHLFNIDTTRLNTFYGTTAVKIYIGVILNKGVWITCDINNDNSFANEKKYFIPTKTIASDLSAKYRKKIEYIYNGVKKVSVFSFVIKPVIRYAAGVSKSIEEISGYLITHKVAVAKLRVGLKSYKLYALQTNSKVIYDAKNTIFGILTKHHPKYDYRFAPLKISTPFNIGRKLYTIDSISPYGNSLKLTYTGQNALADLKTIIDSPVIYNIESNSFKSIMNYLGVKKFLILNFWGTWCSPCIAELPLLKEFYNSIDSSQYSLLSIAFDAFDNLNKVRQLIDSNHLNWNQGLLNRENETETLINKLGIYSYPTFLIIDADGNIIFREIGESALNKIQSFILLHSNQNQIIN